MTRAPHPPLLRVDDLTVTFPGAGEPAVNGISFTLERGCALGVVGESGSGKSLTALAVMGLLPPAARVAPGAAVRLDGSDLLAGGERALRAVRGRRMAIVFQDPMACLNPYMTVGRQIAETLRRHRPASDRPMAERVAALLDEVGIADARRRLSSHPHELSGGQQQRAMIAMALAGDPDLLIADEPTTALDATVQRQILDLLGAIRERRRMAMLFISHDLGVVSAVADTVAVMRRGRIVEQGPAGALLRRPRHPYTAELVGARRGLTARPASPSPRHGAAPVLEAVGLAVDHRGRGLFGRPFRAAEGIDITLHAGRTLGLVGESGSGKSSVARALAGLHRPSGGEIRLLGTALSAHRWRIPPALRPRCQMVFQNPYGALNPRLTVARLLAEPLEAVGRRAEARDRGRLAAALESVGLPAALLDRYPHELSGGQRQRVCITRSLLTEPRVLLCDEVVSALDLTTQVRVLDLLKGLQAAHGFAMLFIGHDLEVVRRMSDEVAVMQAGRIVERGETERLFTAPRHPYTARLLAAALPLPQAAEEPHRGVANAV
ncbi:dipeptide ABC transporter ATP-binding protein [Azospirillum halopraeferens]|uniref:dipeptide ABC transporter ATP-binding protein n=1 Tax=Azospirillum halopraeferens TaxID=34010 RepID=UPI0003F4ECD3|nr:ABC transporter ATP-binding protein [Azospirillum halopraeferens]